MSEARSVYQESSGEWAWPWVRLAHDKQKQGAPITAIGGKPTERATRVQPKVSSLWTGGFSDLSPSDFGTPEFHGRFHPEIVAQAILRYIPPERRRDALIWDPMAGGGTTGDVAKEFGVACAMTDINPTRLDIRRFDATAGAERAWRMIGGRPVDLLILHPPYWSAVKYDTGGDLADTAEEFAAWFSRIATTTVPLVRHGGYIVFVVGNLYRDKELHPLDLYCIPVLRVMGLVIKGRVAKDFGETKGGWKRHAAINTHRALKFGYWRYDWEQVFYLKKLGEHFPAD